MYSVHHHAKNYESVLGILSSTSTNSSQTSSLPLADFWRPERFESPEIKALCQVIGIKFEDLDPKKKADYCFEYPTPAYKDDDYEETLDHSKPSMTDLMIFLKDKNKTRITIEAKYTEYGKNGEEKKYTPFLQNWYDKDDPTDETRKKRMAILKRWTEYIDKSKCGCKCNLILENEIPKDWQEFPYQFLHRTASACFNCKHPILVYQLFYDKDNFDEMKTFENHLKEWAEMLIPKENKQKLPFFIVETEVKPESPAFAEELENPSDLFIYMKNKAQYTFGKEITVLNGYDLTQVTPKQ